MGKVWLEEFESLFKHFLPDPWILQEVENKPLLRLQQALDQHHYIHGVNQKFKMFVDSAKVRFCCDNCGHGWTSMKGRVIFWYELFDLTNLLQDDHHGCDPAKSNDTGHACDAGSEKNETTTTTTINETDDNMTKLDKHHQKDHESKANAEEQQPVQKKRLNGNEGKGEGEGEGEDGGEDQDEDEGRVGEGEGDGGNNEIVGDGAASGLHDVAGGEDRKKRQVGYCAYKLFGQQCDGCNQTDKFERPMWYPEEVGKVLNNFYNKIGQVYYGFKAPAIDKQRRAGKPKTSHNG